MGCLHSGSSFDEVQTHNGAIYISKDEPAITWEYLEDINSANWVPYDDKTSRQINVAYTSEAKKCQITNKGNGHSFEIDFNLMIETNVINGWQRKVRMQPYNPKKAASNLHPKQYEVPQKSLSSQIGNARDSNEVNPNPLLLQQEPSPNDRNSNPHNNHNNDNNTKYKWQWYSESIGWKDYDEKLSNKIDDAWCENVARYAFKIRSNNTKYEIDFDRKKQCNLDTMKLRIIRRVPLSIPLPSEPVSSPSGRSIDDILNEENERFVWEHYDESDAQWHEYGDNVSLKIETVHHSNAAVARMKIHGVEYEIRLNEMPMNQYNLRSGKISPIRRMVKSKHVKRESNVKTSVDIPMMEPHAYTKKAKYEWRYKEGLNVWKVYPNDINIKIEKAFRAEVDHFSFSINSQQYEIQFNFLRQVNLATNDINEIARIDNVVQKRAQTMFNGSDANHHHNIKISHEPAKSFNPMDIDAAAVHVIPRQKSKHNKRSATLDITKKNANANANENANAGSQDFDFLVKQQQKAMKYFKVKHSKKNSSKQMEENDNDNDTNDSDRMEDREYYNNNNDTSADLDRSRWMLRNDNGDWLYYPPSVSSQIEEAYQGGEDSINITRNGIVYEVRIEHNLECHFGTNKVRPIKRVNINANIEYDEINYKPKPKPKQKAKANGHHNVDLDIQFDALSNKLDDFGDALSHGSNEEEAKENEELSDYDEHDDDEKDYEYRDGKQVRTTPQQPIDMTEDDEESYHEQGTLNEDEDERAPPKQPQEPEAATPADSEFALKDYGNDYNEYIQKFNNLNQGYFE